jgi:hypothetical protein
LPVTVTVTVPVVALLDAVNVSVLVPVAGFGLNAAVVPDRIPLADNVTLPVNPPEGEIVIVDVPFAPRVIVTLVGEADRVKFPAAAGLTVSEMVVLPFAPDPVPLIVTFTVPVVAVLDAVNVTVLVLVAGFGLNPAVTPLGNPDALNVTLPLNPFVGVIVIVEVPVLPCVTETLLGEADSVKPGCAAAVTVSEMVVLAFTPDPVPPIVTDTVPVVAVLEAVNVTVLVPVAGFGLNPAVTPLGSPDAVNVTLPLNPPEGVIVIVEVPVLPWVTATLLGEADNVKLGVCVDPGQFATRFAAFTVPIPVAKSHPVDVP